MLTKQKGIRGHTRASTKWAETQAHTAFQIVGVRVCFMHKKGGKEMRKKFLRIITCTSLILCACNTEVQAKTEMVAVDNLYIMETRVIEFEERADIVVVEAESGHMYAFHGIEDWELEDRCVLLMDDCGTESITDDVIVRTYYRR